MTVTSEYTYDEMIPEDIREVVERHQPHFSEGLRVDLKIGDGTFNYRIEVDENGHVHLIAKTVIW